MNEKYLIYEELFEIPAKRDAAVEAEDMKTYLELQHREAILEARLKEINKWKEGVRKVASTIGYALAILVGICFVLYWIIACILKWSALILWTLE